MFLTLQGGRGAPQLREEDPAHAPVNPIASRWRALLDWSGEPISVLEAPQLYAGPAGGEVLRASTGRDLATTPRLALEPLDQFQPLDGACNAAPFAWGGVDLATCSDLTLAALLRCDVVLANDPHTARLLSAAGVSDVVHAPTPIAPEQSFAMAPSPPDDPPTDVIWSVGDGVRADLAPLSVAEAMGQRVGPVFLASIDPDRDPRGFAALLSAAGQVGAGRVVVAIQSAEASFDDIRAQFALDQAAVDLGGRLGFLAAPPTPALISAAAYVVAPSTGPADHSAETRLWLSEAVLSGCALIAPNCPLFEDLAPTGGGAPPGERVRWRWRQDDDWRVEDGWIAAAGALGQEIAAAVASDEDARQSRVADMRAALGRHASFEAVWARLREATSEKAERDEALS